MRSTAAAYPRGATSKSYLKTICVAVVVIFLFYVMFSDSPRGTGGSLRQQSKGTAKLSELLAVGLDLSEQAAKVIKEVKQSGAEELKVKGQTKEGVDEPVTVADTLSNKIFVNGFRNHFPGVNMLSEETEPERDLQIRAGSLSPPLNIQERFSLDPKLDLNDVLVIVDPLDATKEFGENLLEYVTTMVCIVHQGEPIAGIINEVFIEDKPPVTGIVPLGDPGSEGTLFNRQKGEATEAAKHTVVISRSHTGEGGNVVETYIEGHDVMLAGGAGYKALAVLDGRAEAYIHVTAIKSWDVCAAEAVTKAAGGAFTDIAGQALQYPMVYDSAHSQALFTNGIVATSSADEHAFFISKLAGRLE